MTKVSGEKHNKTTKFRTRRFFKVGAKMHVDDGDGNRYRLMKETDNANENTNKVDYKQTHRRVVIAAASKVQCYGDQ